MFSWYWPTSNTRYEQAERKLFEKYRAKFHIHHVPVSLSLVAQKSNTTFTSSESSDSLDDVEEDVRDKEKRKNEKKKIKKKKSWRPHTNDLSYKKGYTNEYINTITVEPFDYEDDKDFKETEKYEGDIHRVDVVIGHGYGCGLGHFFKNLEEIALTTKMRVHAIDWLGCGGSSRPDMPCQPTESAGRLSEKMYIETLEQWRANQNIDQMILVGHSLGGYKSVVYAMKYPKRIAKLILISPVGIPQNPTTMETEGNDNDNDDNKPKQNAPSAPLLQRMLFGIVRYGWENNITAQSVVRGLGPAGPSFSAKFVARRMPNLSPEEQELLSNYLYHISTKKPAGEYAQNTILTVGAWARNPLINRIHNLKVPTVFCYGETDWMDPKGGQAAMEKMKGVKTKIRIVGGAGHNIMVDNAKGFNRLVIEEIQEIREDLVK